LLLGGVAYLAARGGRFRLAGFSVSVPSRKVLLCQIGLAIGDLVPAAAVFYILLPQAYAPDFSTVLAVYVGAMYLGLAANTPGGLGAFELACLTLLPDIPTADTLSTLVLYRLIYNGGPFVLALVLLGRHEFSAKVRADHNAARLPQVFSLPEVRGEILRINKTQPFAEAGLALQGDKAFLVAHYRAYMMFSDTSTHQIAMGDPLGDPASFPALLDRFEARARSFRRKPVIYKAREDMLPKYESRGWRSLPIGQEAVVKLADYTLQKPAMRELRRKLRKAEKAGVRVICHPAGTAPYARLQGISDVWLMAKAGDESRFSIGHFAPEYLDHALVFEARHNKKTIAFLTVWTESNGCEWSLDLMRGVPDVPDGVMHALVHAAITAAQKQNVENFNLCFVPFWVRPNASRWSRSLCWMFHNASALQEARGLYRFKNSFRPAWHQRYLVTPSRLPIGAVLAVRKLVRGN
ncbi:MAG TPA: phosphatidylglycerol lysyltransferase domain-containing protein, partial [Paracoccaceae bacterium]|nr:phosphatidylglycerol lysyltransferase domain-containing protein [Paracoccaceae bacterium]